MGTNYHLLIKNRIKDLNELEQDPSITKLRNGYVYEEIYYKTLQEVADNYYTAWHIGKSSAGWRFTLCAYPHPRDYKPIITLQDWKEMFKLGKIVDEYGKELTAEEMVNIISNRKGNFDLDVNFERLAEGYGEGTWYDNKHNLLGHNKATFVCDPEATYDITEEYNFS